MGPLDHMAPEHWFVLTALLQAADVYTTLRALKLGGREANPLIKRLMDAIGVKEALLLVKIAALIPLWVFRDLTPVWAWAFLVAFYGWVLWNNAGVIRKLKEKQST